MTKAKSSKKSSTTTSVHSSFKQVKSGRTLRSGVGKKLDTQLDIGTFLQGKQTQSHEESQKREKTHSAVTSVPSDGGPQVETEKDEDIVSTLLSDRESLLGKLRDFDLVSKYGPCVGMTRLERWNRAKKLKLNPPEDIGFVLNSVQVKDDPELRESLWNSVL